MSARPGLRELRVIGAREHNLRSINVDIPRNALTVVTGLSGSGKSSLAFDTIHAEGRRRYIESMSSYARQFLDPLERPDVDHIEGLSPTISIEQKTVSRNPRSTVGTITEIYDHLRVLFSVLGKPHCPHCDRALEAQTARAIVDRIMGWPEGTRVVVAAPIVRGRKGIYRKEMDDALARGYVRAKIDGEYRMLDEPIALERNKAHHIAIVIDRIVVGPDERARFDAAIDKAIDAAEGLVLIDVLEGAKVAAVAAARRGGRKATPETLATLPPAGEQIYSLALSCPEHGPQLVELTPRTLSFNSPHGWCPQCQGVGVLTCVDVERIVPNPSASLAEGCIAAWDVTGLAPGTVARGRGAEAPIFRRLCRELKIDLDVPWKKLPAATRDLLLNGVWFTSATAKAKYEAGKVRASYTGVVRHIEERLKATENEGTPEDLLPYLGEQTCPACGGARLRPEALAVKVLDRSIAAICTMPIDGAAGLFGGATWTARDREIAGQVLKEIVERLGFLRDVGVGYLTLDRMAGSLAGGEAQRIRLAAQIGSRLTGVLYVLDEPSIGLHMRDNAKLIATLERLRDGGNTVIVVEHDEATMRAADYLVDLGPGAGRLGGEVVAAGKPAVVLQHPTSRTAGYLRGELSIALPAERHRPDKGRFVRVVGAREHNLRGVTVDFPLGCFICVSGVSGSGKSTLVNEVLVRALGRAAGLQMPTPGLHERIEGAAEIDKVIEVDQTPIGRTPRSNVATYTGVFTPIRDLFAALPESQVRGYPKGRFSFNVEGGRCEACAGDGHRRIEMSFLPEVYVPCEVCHTRRYNDETLQVYYRGKSIADVLEMTVGEALEFFEPVPSINKVVQTLHDVGLDYIHLGQPAPTFSGGEAQRIKLSRELARRNTGKTFYVLDEPTTGLHFDDVRRLIDALRRLVAEGSTVIVIEHHLDVIKSADWVIDLGPEGGDAGGEVVAVGPPEAIARCGASYTGRYLREVLG